MATSITAALGSGSGIDTKALVDGLVKAQFDAKTAALTRRSEKLTAQISSLGQLRSGLTGFSTALGALVSSGTLSTQPTSGDASVFTAAASAGGRVGALANQIEVRALATGQSVASAAIAGGAVAPSGTGTLTIRLGTPSYDSGGAVTGFTAKAGASAVTVTVGAEQNSLAGLAAAINGANAGVTASVIGDGASARLAIRGATGVENGFKIEAAEGDVPGLSRFAFAPGAAAMSVGQRAADAVVALDGIAVTRGSNTISDLVPGVTLGLVSAAVGRPISLGSTRPTTAIGQAVDDFVAAFNELRGVLRTETDPVNGALGGDPAARAMARQLGSLTSTRLVEGVATGAPTSLAELGVRTNRDGTLSVDNARLQASLVAYPEAVEAMFSPRQSASSPLLTVVSGAGRVAPGGYAVTGLKPATAGILVGGAVPSAFDTPVVIDAANAQITASINGGAPVAVTLAEGSYADGEALAAAFNAAIAAAPLAAGRARVSWADSRFTVRSSLEDAGSSIAITGGDATLALRIGFATASATNGAAAEGMIAGKPATWLGGVFSAAADSPAAGLQLRAAGPVADALVRIDLGLGAALKATAERLTTGEAGFTAAEARYAKLKAAIATDQEKAESAADRMSAQLTKSFATMDARVAAYKATGSFLEQQIKVWTQDR